MGMMGEQCPPGNELIPWVVGIRVRTKQNGALPAGPIDGIDKTNQYPSAPLGQSNMVWGMSSHIGIWVV